MTATERQLLREIRDLQARIVQLENTNARLRDRLRDERRQAENRYERLARSVEVWTGRSDVLVSHLHRDDLPRAS